MGYPQTHLGRRGHQHSSQPWGFRVLTKSSRGTSTGVWNNSKEEGQWWSRRCCCWPCAGECPHSPWVTTNQIKTRLTHSLMDLQRYILSCPGQLKYQDRLSRALVGNRSCLMHFAKRLPFNGIDRYGTEAVIIPYLGGSSIFS